MSSFKSYLERKDLKVISNPAIQVKLYLDLSKNNWISLQLDLENDGTIIEAGFGQSERNIYTPYLYFLCDWIVNKEISYAQIFSLELCLEFFNDDPTFLKFWEDKSIPFLFYPSELVRLSHQYYQGIIPSVSEVKKLDKFSLICRCFGVYKGEVENFIQNTSEVTINSISANLKAGAGCGSCIEDLEDLLFHSAQNSNSVDVDLGLQAEVVSSIEKTIFVWKKYSPLYSKFFTVDVNLEIGPKLVKLESQIVYIKWDLPNHNDFIESLNIDELSASLKKYIQEKFPELVIIFI